MKLKCKGPIYKRTCNGIERVRPVSKDRETHTNLGTDFKPMTDYTYPIEIYKPTGGLSGTAD